MAGQRQPIELVQARGKKHLTQEEIRQRMNSEVKPVSYTHLTLPTNSRV